MSRAKQKSNPYLKVVRDKCKAEKATPRRRKQAMREAKKFTNRKEWL